MTNRTGPRIPARAKRLLEEQEPREVTRGLALVQLAALLPSELLAVDGAQDVDGALHAADLIQGLVRAVLACVRADAGSVREMPFGRRLRRFARTVSSHARRTRYGLTVPSRIG